MHIQRRALGKAALLGGIFAAIGTRAGAAPLSQVAHSGAAAASWFQSHAERWLGGPGITGWALTYRDHDLRLTASGGNMDVTSPAHVASCSKPITAVALMRLLERRGWDEARAIGPILAERFSSIAPEVGVLTVEQLLSHNTGWRFGYVSEPIAAIDLEARNRNLRALLSGETARDAAPGTYSNVNYALARELIEILSGDDYTRFVRSDLFAPLGIGASTDPTGLDVQRAYALGRDDDGKAMDRDHTVAAGAYGWYASADDLARFGTALAQGEILPDDVVTRMIANEMGFFRGRDRSTVSGLHSGHFVLSGGYGVHSNLALTKDGGAMAGIVNTNSGAQILAASELWLEESTPVVNRIFDGARGGWTIRVIRPLPADSLRITLPNGGDMIYREPFFVPFGGELRAAPLHNGEMVGPAAILDVNDPRG